MPSRRASRSQLNRVNSRGQPMCAYVCRNKLSKTQKKATLSTRAMSNWQLFVHNHRSMKTADGRVDFKKISAMWKKTGQSGSAPRSRSAKKAAKKRRSSSARRSASAKKRRSSSAKRSASKKRGLFGLNLFGL